tara:strand:- start:7323 stop:8027 length:705 start_codon:yes stop_codon:yes gene_type:complete
MIDPLDFYNEATLIDFGDTRSANDNALMELSYIVGMLNVCETYNPFERHFLEFGVWKGRSINYLADTLQEWDLTLYGFDSFEGLPEHWEWGMPGKNPAPKGMFNLDGKRPEVRDNVNLVAGWFHETLPVWWPIHKGPIAFLNLDCDIYRSTKYVLETLNDGIVKDTIIRFDDLVEWRADPFPYDKEDKRAPGKRYYNWKEGQWKALNEWAEKYEREAEPFSRTWNKSGTVVVIK